MIDDTIVAQMLVKYSSEVVAGAKADAVALAELRSQAKLSVMNGGTSSPLVGTVAGGASSAEASAASAEKQSKALGTLGLAFAGAGVAAGLYSIHMAAAFDQASAHVLAGTSVTKQQLDEVKKDVIDLSLQTGQSATSIMSAFYNISSSVSDTAAAREILNRATKFGAAFDTDATTATSLLTGVYNAYHLSIKDIPGAQDALTQAVRLGAAEARDLAPAYANVIPLAAHMGISLQTLGAMFAESTNAGISAAESGVRIGNMLQQLNAPTAQQIKAVHALGGEYSDLRVHHGDVIGTLERLNQLMHVATPSVQQISDATGLSATKAKIWADELSNADGRARMLFGGSQAAALEFFNAMNDGGVQQHKLLRQMADDAGTTESSFKTAMNNSQADFNKAKTAAEALAIEVGGPLAKAASALLQEYVPAAQQVAQSNHDSGTSWGFLGDAILKVVSLNNREAAWWLSLPGNVKALGDALGVTTQKADIGAMTQHRYAAEIGFLKSNYDELSPPMKDHLTRLETEYAQFESTTRAAKEKAAAIEKTADAYGHLLTKMGGVDGRGIVLGEYNAPGGSGGPPPGVPQGSSAPILDLQKQIKDFTKTVQDDANRVYTDEQTHSASLGRDTAILDSHRETLIRLQKEEDTLTSVTKAVHQSLDPLSVASKAQSDAAKQIQSDYSLLGYVLPGHIAAYEKATDTVNRLNLAVSNITANQQYAKFRASQQGVSNDIAELQHQSVLLGQSVSMTAEQKAVAQAQLQVEIDSKQVLLDTLKLQQIRAEHGNKQQIASAKATVTSDIYKLDESKGALSVSIRAEDLAKVEQHYKLVEQTDSNAIQELQHQSAMIGLNTSMSSEQKAVAQAQLQVQIDQRQIALDTAKLMGVLADPNHTASDVAAARGQLSQDSGKLQEDQASLRNAKATDEATRAIQKWTRETSQHSQKADEAMDALAFGIRNHDTPAQLEKLALAAANAQSLVNGDGTAHQKAADMVTKLLDPGIKLAGVFKQIADSGQSAADWLTKNFGQQGSQHTFGFGGFGVTGGQLEHANDPKTPPVTQTDINADFALKDLSKAATDNTAAFQAGTIDQTQYIQNLKQINTGTDAWNQKLIAADIKMGDWTGALALAKPLFDSGVMSFSDFVTIQKGADAATAAKTQKDWDAAFAAGDLATKSSMLSQLFGGLVSRASTIAGAQSSVDNARLGVIAANSDVQVGLLQSLLTETQDLSSIASAHQGVQTAIFTGELAKINDGVTLMQVIASGQQAQQATLQAIQQDAQKGDAQKLGLDQRLLAAQQQAGRDAITVATLQMEADQANARMQLKVAQDGEKMAIDKLAVDRVNDANAAKLSLDKLAIAKDTYNSSVAQQKLTLDTMPILAEIAANTSPDGTTVNDYGAMVKADLAGILGLQKQGAADQSTLGNDQAGANQDSASGNLLLGNDQSQTNSDSNAALQTQQLGELEIARAKAKEAGDNLMVSTLQAAISALQANTSSNTGNTNIVAELQAKIKDLNGLLKQQNLPLNRRPGGGGSTLRTAYGQTGASAAVNGGH